MRREFVARARPSDVGHDIETTRRWVVDRLREAHEEELARPKRYDPPTEVGEWWAGLRRESRPFTNLYIVQALL